MIMDIKYRRDLYKLLPPDFVSVELGIAEGFFSRDILEMGASKHYMVDAWQQLDQSGDGGHEQSWHDANYNAAVERVAPYGERAIILRGLSDHMAHQIEDNSLDLVYIDAWHAYEGVRNDINNYWPKLKSGGVMAFHDMENSAYGVKAAVLEFCFDNNIKLNLIPEDKPEDAGAWIRKP